MQQYRGKRPKALNGRRRRKERQQQRESKGREDKATRSVRAPAWKRRRGHLRGKLDQETETSKRKKEETKRRRNKFSVPIKKDVKTNEGGPLGFNSEGNVRHERAKGMGLSKREDTKGRRGKRLFSLEGKVTKGRCRKRRGRGGRGESTFEKKEEFLYGRR